MAAFAAALIGSGTSKCGCPMLKFTGFLSVRASSNAFRTPETSIALHRSASHDSENTERPQSGMATKKYKRHKRKTEDEGRTNHRDAETLRQDILNSSVCSVFFVSLWLTLLCLLSSFVRFVPFCGHYSLSFPIAATSAASSDSLART